MLRWPIQLLAVSALLTVVISCAPDDSGQVATDQWTATVLHDGLDGPTQLAVGPDGAWFVAQLAGGENDGDGQVVRLDPGDPAGSAQGDRIVVLDGLDKPTGVAVFAGDLWLMERDRLIRSELDGSQRRTVVDELAFNGRSEGSLTVDGDRLLFTTSGRLSTRTDRPVDPKESSGVLWSIDADEQVEPVAWGFKHAYSQVRSADGTLWTTEIADGQYDGQAAVDELVAVGGLVDHGWPRCVGDNRAVDEFGGSAQVCDGVPRPHALFEIGATPTSVAVPPWDPTTLVVALWVSGDVVVVSTDPELIGAQPVVVFDGADHPQDLVADGERLLLVDHGAGEIIELAPPPTGT